MKVKDMFTKEFAEQYGDIDVYDDICEELAIAFCGPLELTGQGTHYFEMVLEDEVNINEDRDLREAMVLIDHLPEGVWQKHLKKLCELFEGAAGFCTVNEYEEWFSEVE